MSGQPYVQLEAKTGEKKAKRSFFFQYAYTDEVADDPHVGKTTAPGQADLEKATKQSSPYFDIARLQTAITVAIYLQIPISM